MSSASAARFSIGNWILILAAIAGIAGAAGLHFTESRSRAPVPVPAHALPAHHLVRRGDIVERDLQSSALANTTVREHAQIVGHFTLQALPEGEAVDVAALGPALDPSQLANTVEVGIPATAAMVLGAGLQAGDVVDVMVVATAAAAGQQIRTEFPNLTVLSVSVDAARTGDRPYTVVVALPVDRRQEFATAIGGGSLVITRNLAF